MIIILLQKYDKKLNSQSFATIFLHFLAYSCRKVSKKDKIAAKSNNFWEFMLDIVEKVLTLQRIWEDKPFWHPFFSIRFTYNNFIN